MKLKKHISKLLFCSILLNSMSFYSNAASNSNLSRYETLEGEVINLGDAKSEDITEIEIFGNTIQDSNNLEDIQSVGDLYVNEEGEPILDKQGRKQYKIEIDSQNTMLIEWDKYDLVGGRFWNGNIEPGYIDNVEKLNSGFKFQHTGSWTRGVVVKGVKGLGIGIYTLEFNHTSFPNNWEGTFFSNINTFKNGNFVEQANSNTVTTIKNGKHTHTFNLTKEFDTLWFDIGISDTNSYGFHQIENIKLYKGEYLNLDKIKSTKRTLLLPCQLMKVGNTRDKLYWDSVKGQYIIEKKIEVYIPDNQTINSLIHNGAENSGFQKTYTSLSQAMRNKIGGSWHSTTNSFSNLFKATNELDLTYSNRESIALGPQYFYIKYDVTKHKNLENFKTFLIENELYLLYITSIPELIETNITKKIELTTYPEKTYISTVSENGVKPILKIAVDKIEEVSQEAVDNVLSSPTSNNIALARMFINMLPESLYKDQLQAQLNEIFSEDMVLDKLSSTANLDVYIQSENILMMSLDTNTVTFEDYSGVEELEIKDAIGISINSSLPYQLNAYVVGEITNKDKNKTLDLDVLNIRDNSQLEYKKFESINHKLVLLDNIEKGNNINHNIDLKLSGNKAHDADVYKTTIKFEIEQK